VTPPIRLRLAGCLAAGLAGLGLAGCASAGADPSSTPVAAGGPAVVVETPAATVSSTQSSTAPGAHTTNTQGSSAPPAATSPAAGAGRAPSGASAPKAAGAAPGTYPAHLSRSSSFGGKPYDGPGTLTVAAAAPDATQVQTVSRQGDSGGAATTYDFLPSGEVTIVALGSSGASSSTSGCDGLQATFTPPIQAVPATLAAGTRWSGSFSGGGVSGTYSGMVTGSATDAVGGVAVAVWRLHGSVDLTGTVCGYQAHAVVTLDSDWAPALRLSVTSNQAVDATVTGLHVTSTSAIQLTSATPS
jgi:hypothetical protein